MIRDNVWAFVDLGELPFVIGGPEDVDDLITACSSSGRIWASDIATAIDQANPEAALTGIEAWTASQRRSRGRVLFA